jgi:hypothetical protein
MLLEEEYLIQLREIYRLDPFFIETVEESLEMLDFVLVVGFDCTH